MEQAARRSGKSERQCSRKCGSGGAWALFAKTEVVDGRARWVVRSDADAQLARVRFADDMRADLRNESGDHRKRIHCRLAVLKEWEKFRSTDTRGRSQSEIDDLFLDMLNNGNLPVKLVKGVKIGSDKTLRNLRHAYRESGIAGLCDGRSVKVAGEAGEADPFLEEVQRQWLDLKKPTLAKVVFRVEYIARQNGWTIRSYKACQRHINRLPPKLVVKLRDGEDAYVDKCEPFIQRDYTTIDSNDAWCADHHQMDVVVICDGKRVRPWLSVFQDLRSRKIVGWSIFGHDPNAEVILGVFRQAAMDYGLPKNLFLDNGKDYDSKVLNGRTKQERWEERKIKIELSEERGQGVFPQLDIKVRHVWPYHGQSKPVERWFANIEDANRSWPTYCGNCPDNRPENHQAQLDRNKAPTIQDYTQWFADWLAAHDAGHKHTGHGMNGQTPDAVYAANLKHKMEASAGQLDVLCLMRVGPVKVGQNGVTYKGLQFGQYEPALHRLFGSKVILRIDERDIRSVQVYSEDDRFVCLAPCNARLGVLADSQDLRKAIQQKRGERADLKKHHNPRMRIADDFPALVVNAATARAAESSHTPAASIVEQFQHPMDSQLPAIARAKASNAPMKIAGHPKPMEHFVDEPTGEKPAQIGMSFAQLMEEQAKERDEQWRLENERRAEADRAFREHYASKSKQPWDDQAEAM